MIEVFTLDGNLTTNITPLCKTITISGDIGQVARKLDITMAYVIFDQYQPQAQIPIGAKLWVALDGEKIFTGIVWDRQISSTQEMSITAYDYLIYLTKSKVTYNFQNITCQDAAKRICDELGVSFDTLAQTGRFSRIIRGKTGFDAITEMYQQSSKVTGKQYVVVINGINVSVIERGLTIAEYKLVCQLGNSNILGTSYHNSIDSMVNKVKIYDDKNNLIGQVQNADWIKSFGVLQDNYVREDNINPMTAANNMLNGITQEITIDAIGNWSCRAGYAVKTEIFYSDVLSNAIMYINSDTHSWDVATNKYTMSLSLGLKEVIKP